METGDVRHSSCGILCNRFNKHNEPFHTNSIHNCSELPIPLMVVDIARALRNQ